MGPVKGKKYYTFYDYVLYINETDKWNQWVDLYSIYDSAVDAMQRHGYKKMKIAAHVGVDLPNMDDAFAVANSKEEAKRKLDIKIRKYGIIAE